MHENHFIELNKTNVSKTTDQQVKARTWSASAQEVFVVHHLVPLVPVGTSGAVLHGCERNKPWWESVLQRQTEPEERCVYPERPTRICRWPRPTWAASGRCWPWSGRLPPWRRSAARQKNSEAKFRRFWFVCSSPESKWNKSTFNYRYNQLYNCRKNLKLELRCICHVKIK